MFLGFKTVKQWWRRPCEDGKTTGRRTGDVLAELTALLRSSSSRSSSQDEAVAEILFTSSRFSRTYRTSGLLAFILTLRSSILCPRHGGGKKATFKHFCSRMFPERLLPLIQRLCCHRFSVGLLSNDAARAEMRI